MNKQLPDAPTLELFDEVKIKPGVYPGYSTGDNTVEDEYIVVKKYSVELGGYDTAFVDILRFSDVPGERIEGLGLDPLERIIAAPRWHKPYILSFPAENIIHLK
jgi:hypothetical protein